MNNVMIDLETLSVSNNASVLVIAGVKFNRNGNADKNTFYRRITLDSCIKLGLDINNETVEWWNKQPEDIKKEIFEEKDRIDISTAIREFTEWFGNCKYIWSHGSCFDCVILTEIYKRLNLQTPWMFYNIRDTRTLFDLGNVRMNDLSGENKHHALADCYRQIEGIRKSLIRLKLIK